jgi:hypothetical protein
MRPKVGLYRLPQVKVMQTLFGYFSTVGQM